MSPHKELWKLRPWSRHGRILTIGGVIYIMIGSSYMVQRPSSNRDIALQAVIKIAPLQVWGSIFVLAGLLSIISSRWPPKVEMWGYVVLTGISLMWGTAYLTGVTLANSPAANIGGALLWSLLGLLWWSIAGLRNPELLDVIHGARPR